MARILVHPVSYKYRAVKATESEYFFTDANEEWANLYSEYTMTGTLSIFYFLFFFNITLYTNFRLQMTKIRE